MVRKLLLSIYLILFFTSFSQADESLDWYYSKAEKAILEEKYETAVEFLEEGKKVYPLSPKLNLLQADLYYDKKIYRLALTEYLEAEEKGGEDFYTLNQISRCFGQLNQEEDSIRYLQKMLKLYPDSIDTIDDLGWMYFKTHQLKEGEKLLLEAIGEINYFGMDRGLLMTLGTIYSGMYDYENSKHYYIRAIEEANKSGDNYFSSVAYYNISLLEHSFYNYYSALRFTEESIASADRASGHLAKGELHQSAMDFRLALSEYQKALAKDTTPLSKVNLAMLYQEFGQLELARVYAEEVLASRELSWMYYYGTDLERHYKDVHEILADVYQGLACVETMKPEVSLLKRIGNLFRSLKFRLLAYYHRQKFRVYSIRVGKAYLKQKNYLDAYWEFYKGNEAYRKTALKYLSMAREIEIQVAPHSHVFYQQEEAKLLKDVDLLRRSISDMDPYWEKEGIFDSLKLMIPLLKRGSPEYREAVNRVYTINPGGLQQYGFGLPLKVTIIQDYEERKDKRIGHIVRLLKRAGSEIACSKNQKGYRYMLSIHLKDDKKAVFSLTDQENQITLRRNDVDLETGRASKQASQIVQTIVDLIYSMD